MFNEEFKTEIRNACIAMEQKGWRITPIKTFNPYLRCCCPLAALTIQRLRGTIPAVLDFFTVEAFLSLNESEAGAFVNAFDYGAHNYHADGAVHEAYAFGLELRAEFVDQVRE